MIASYEASYGEEGLLELARRSAKTGVCYSTPVFEGPDFENDIQPLLKELGLSEYGAYIIRDGRTGEYFDQPVTVEVFIL